MTAHLTDLEISDILVGAVGVPLHATECAACARRLEQLRTPLANFRAAMRSWSSEPSLLTYRAPRPAGLPSFAYSMTIHASLVALLFAIASFKPMADLVRQQVSGPSVLLSPFTAARKVAPGAGGGGGGAREVLAASKGVLPKAAPRQFAPPRVDPVNAKLPEAATIVAPDDIPNITANNFGDPLSKLGIPSNGAGFGGGIGNGAGGGVGAGRGDGFGPGEGGGFGGGVYRLGSAGVSAPIVIFKREPEYSEEARKAKWQGEVALQVIVDANGMPVSVKVTRSLGLGLDEKAVEAVSKWRFKPATKDGKPVAVSATILINFRLL